MKSDRDIIAAELIRQGAVREEGNLVFMKYEMINVDHVVAALREARTVSAVEGIDALPTGTVVLENGADGFVMESYWDFVWQEKRWLYPGDDDPQRYPDLPALILYLPDEG